MVRLLSGGQFQNGRKHSATHHTIHAKFGSFPSKLFNCFVGARFILLVSVLFIFTCLLFYGANVYNHQTLYFVRLTSPLILIVIAGVAYACHRIRAAATPVQLWFVPNRTLTTGQQCAAVSVASVPLLYLAGAGSAMFWVMGASWFFVSAHAIFYNIDAIVTEDETDGFVV